MQKIPLSIWVIIIQMTDIVYGYLDYFLYLNFWLYRPYTKLPRLFQTLAPLVLTPQSDCLSYSRDKSCINNLYTCSALQLSTRRWLKVSIFQGSITILDILPNGQIALRALGDVGHLTPNIWTGGLWNNLRYFNCDST